MDHILTTSARLRRLRKLAIEVREISTNRPGGDLEGWRVSRLLRDASTLAEADEAERQFESWEARFRDQSDTIGTALPGIAERNDNARRVAVMGQPQHSW